MEVFEHLGGTPQEILYDRMKTAVLGESKRHIVYNAKLAAFAAHYSYVPRACKPYRAKTKGKVERPYRYIRQDFYLARQFQNLSDLNVQFHAWLNEVANARIHGTTQRVVRDHCSEEKSALQQLPAGQFNGGVRLERRASHEGLVSVGGNYYSVPDRTRRRVLEVHSLAQEVRIYEDGILSATHPVLEGRRQTSMLPGQRRSRSTKCREFNSSSSSASLATPRLRRPLAFYDLVGRRLAREVTCFRILCQPPR